MAAPALGASLIAPQAGGPEARSAHRSSIKWAMRTCDEQELVPAMFADYLASRYEEMLAEAEAFIAECGAHRDALRFAGMARARLARAPVSDAGR